MIDTRIVGEEPVSLPIKGVLYAEWSPILTDTRIAYSTAERVPSQPGWRANNDLWLWDINEVISEAIEIAPPNTRGFYPWWGTNFTWSPNGQMFAYANANQIGIIDVISQTVTPLVEFAPYQTNSEWVWVPALSWSPNSQFIAAVIHGPPLQNEHPEASQVFDLWLIAADGSVKAKVWEQVGMWSNPVWRTDGIAFGRAINPLRSIDSQYKLTTIDWDGSNPQLLFPLTEEVGLDFPELAWRPGGKSTIFVYRNNLYLLEKDGSLPQQLTTDSQSHRPEWAIPPGLSVVTPSHPVTSSTNLTQTVALTNNKVISFTTLITP
jgi:hypothetical protein